MSEINGPNIGVNQTNYSQVAPKTINQRPEKERERQLTDFSDSKAEMIGRSMLYKKGEDSINNDLKSLLENPQIAENSDEMFETMYKAASAAGADNPYEEAASAATTAM